MLDLAKEDRLTFLTSFIPKALQGEHKKNINTYMIIDPAGKEVRKNIAGSINASFLSMQGIFPADISQAVEMDNEEPQLMLLDEDTFKLLEIALNEDVNAVQVLYSSLTLNKLAEQLKPQLKIIVEDTEQEAYMRYWDGRVFPTLARVIDDNQRQQAFMGNIHGVGLIDEENPETFSLYFVNENNRMSLHTFANIKPEEPINSIKNTLSDYVPFATPMIYTEQDALAFKNNTAAKQIRQMARMLIEHPVVKKNDVKFEDVIDDVEKAAKYAYDKYQIDDTDAIYQFVLASYLLGGRFEKGTELEGILKDENETSTVKRVKIKSFLANKINLEGEK